MKAPGILRIKEFLCYLETKPKKLENFLKYARLDQTKKKPKFGGSKLSFRWEKPFYYLAKMFQGRMPQGLSPQSAFNWLKSNFGKFNTSVEGRGRWLSLLPLSFSEIRKNRISHFNRIVPRKAGAYRVFPTRESMELISSRFWFNYIMNSLLIDLTDHPKPYYVSTALKGLRASLLEVLSVGDKWPPELRKTWNHLGYVTRRLLRPTRAFSEIRNRSSCGTAHIAF